MGSSAKEVMPHKQFQCICALNQVLGIHEIVIHGCFTPLLVGLQGFKHLVKRLMRLPQMCSLKRGYLNLNPYSLSKAQHLEGRTVRSALGSQLVQWYSHRYIIFAKFKIV